MIRAIIYRILIVAAIITAACKQPGTKAKGTLTDSTAGDSSHLFPPKDTGVARAMDSTINSPDKRPGG